MNQFSVFIILLEVLVGIVCFWVGYLIRKYKNERDINSASLRSEQIILDTKQQSQTMLDDAHTKVEKLLGSAKSESDKILSGAISKQRELEQRERSFSDQMLKFQDRQQELYNKNIVLEKELLDVKQSKLKQQAELERISGLNQESAKALLLENVERQCQEDLLGKLKKIETNAESVLAAKAQNILINAVQRCAMSNVSEITSTTFVLPSDEIKGKIIGKEGRNIKTIEHLTGVDLIIDDTPGVIIISGFSPVRRHIAKRALEKLVSDGRIHPARIEEVIAEAKKTITNEIIKAGEDALAELEISGIDPKLVQILGRLKFRTSYGQNVLQHSMEVAYLAKLLAEELKIDPKAAALGGLFHDIGKTVDHDVPGAHTVLGYEIMKRYGFPEEIAYMAIAHHEDSPKTLLGIVVKTADSISGGRPGARGDTRENYIQRLTALEQLAGEFSGVSHTYAIQAGRELRVFVTPEEINDLEAFKLAQDIARKIERSLKYPGDIKVTIIRETRITEYAR